MKLSRIILLFIDATIILTMTHCQHENSKLSDKERRIIEEVENAKITGIPRVRCDSKYITISVKTSVPFQGRIYVNGRAFDQRCTEQFTQNRMQNATIRFPILDCTNVENINQSSGISTSSSVLNNQRNEKLSAFLIWANIRVDFHPTFVTKSSQVFRAECSEVHNLDFDRRLNGTVNTICAHQLFRGRGRRDHGNGENSSTVSEFNVGDVIAHRWSCSDKYGLRKYAMMLHNCNVVSRSKHMVQLIDQTGCTVDEMVMTNLTVKIPQLKVPKPLLLDPSGNNEDQNRDEEERLVATADSYAFKFLEEAELRFQCSIMLIPRASDYSPIELPRCSITKEELQDITTSFPDPFQFLNPDRRLIDNVIEAVTLTKWIRINERLPIANFDRAFPTTSTSDLPTQSQTTKPPVGTSSAPNNHFLRLNDDVWPSVVVSRVQFHANTTDTESEESVAFDDQIDGPLQFDVLSTRRVNSSEKMCPCDAKKFDFLTSENLHQIWARTAFDESRGKEGTCFWHMLNSLLLIWSIGSVLIWLVIFGNKLYKTLFKYASDDDDTVFQDARNFYKLTNKPTSFSTQYGFPTVVNVRRSGSSSYASSLRNALPRFLQ